MLVRSTGRSSCLDHLKTISSGLRGDRSPAVSILLHMEPTIATAAERPDLFRRGSELTGDIWPVYNTHGEVLSVYWSRLAEEFAEFQFVVYDGETGEVLAQGHSIPCAWDGTLEGLPVG